MPTPKGSKQKATLELAEAARAALERYHPMTLRQLHYRLVESSKIEGFDYQNSDKYYKKLGRTVAWARLEGIIPWHYVEDRLRKPMVPAMYESIAELIEEAARRYKQDVWESQDNYVEVWVEKDALSNVFWSAVSRFGVTVNIGRGYDSWTAVHKAAKRLARRGEDHAGRVVVLYYGDFDPSGEDMFRSLGERLADLDCYPETIKRALTLEDIERYDLPPAMTKGKDTRQAAFVAKNGDVSVELDALEPEILAARAREDVASYLDIDAMDAVFKKQEEDRSRLVEWARELE